MTDGNTHAIAQHLDEREDWDALQEVTAELEQAEAKVEELEAKLVTCMKYRDAYAECDRIATQSVRDLETKLAKTVALLDRPMGEMKVYEDDLSGWCDIMERIAELTKERSDEKGETDE